jgi:hypothetical protein
LYLCACKNSVGIVGGTKKKIKFFIFTFVFYHSRLTDPSVVLNKFLYILDSL